jgi:hypothetical protein
MVFGVVYKITCNKTGMIYYGSTTNYNKRIGEHINMVKNDRGYYSARSYLIIQEGDYKFDILEHIEGCKKDLEERERFYIENNKCINRQCPLRTKEESYTCECGRTISSITNRWSHIKTKQHKEYIETGKKYEKPTRTYEEYKYDKINCECGGKYTPNTKATHFKTQRHQNFINQTSS